MANTVISDLAFIPSVFSSYVQNDLWKRSAFFTSGAVGDLGLNVPLVGRTITVPAWQGLTGSSQVLDDDTCLVPKKLVSAKNIAPILRRGDAWSVSDLVGDLTGSDPLDVMANKVSTYWMRQKNKALVATTVGSTAALEADFANQIMLDISGGTGAAAVLSAASIIGARGYFGEYQTDSYTLVMHPAAYAVLVAQDLNDNNRNSTTTNFASYMGMPVVLDSDVPVAAGVYTSYLVRADAFGYAQSNDPAKEYERDRDILCGTDLLTTRQNYVVHPFGAAWIGTAAAEGGPTDVELATAANWDKATIDPLDFGIRAIKHKIA